MSTGANAGCKSQKRPADSKFPCFCSWCREALHHRTGAQTNHEFLDAAAKAIQYGIVTIPFS